MMHPFDAVEIEDEGLRTRVTVDEFLAIPLRERAKLILMRQVTFLCGHDEIDRRIALASLREAAAKAS